MPPLHLRGRPELALEVLAGGVDGLDQVDGDGPELADAEHQCPVISARRAPLHLRGRPELALEVLAGGVDELDQVDGDRSPGVVLPGGDDPLA
ncbi:hypothetical protein [Sorangium sp. So ce363]|uniref:hypothetical protein n=1 Tax=Sorangium sp. So ce363 TaxID=3133304 RepID=UPI003F62B094